MRGHNIQAVNLMGHNMQKQQTGATTSSDSPSEGPLHILISRKIHINYLGIIIINSFNLEKRNIVTELQIIGEIKDHFSYF